MHHLARFVDEPTPLETHPLTSRDDGRLHLVAIGDGFVTSHPMPDSGTVIVGRSPESDVRIDAANISRRHLLIHLGNEITIEDLGSANGTYVHDERLARGEAAVVEAGTIIELGSTMLVLQSGYTAARPRRIWIHDYFEARLEEECLRAERSNRTFSLLRVRATSKQAKAHALQELLLGSLRPCDVVAAYAPDDYEVLISDATPDESHRVLDRLRDSLRRGGAELQTGVAYYPKDGRVPEALMAKATSALLSEGDEAEVPVIVESAVMTELHRFVARVAAGDINALVLGETGVGKEIITERIHALSPRVDKPLLRLNCAALAENLLESELFGHERGAFTGAATAKPGLLEVADGGTVFLDEIGDMPLSIQAKLLRTLEEGSVRRVGGLESRPVDIRIVAATHKDLETEVARGNFRRDLYFRIAGVTLVVPPLRERVDDIPPLANSFVAQACRRQRIQKSVTLSEEALQWMCSYDWPGNIRELRNVVERAVLLCSHGVIGRKHLPLDKLGRAYRLTRETQPLDQILAGEPCDLPLAPPPSARANTLVEPLDLKHSMKARECELVRDALERAAGNQTQAAKLLGVSRRTLIARIEEFGLPRPRKRS